MSEYKGLAIGEIKNIVKSKELKEQITMIEMLFLDNRKGVRDIAISIEKKVKKHELELRRLKSLSSFEDELRKNNISVIAGIDEVGRGPLAGPVVTAAVILPEDYLYYDINDSKKVPLNKRNLLSDEIKKTAIDYSFGMATQEEIDELNILNATKLAMKRAVNGLKNKPEHLLIDAVKLDDIDIRQTSIIKGDEKSVSIAAASILAKVERDNMMVEYSKEYPGYGFENNKGYGTSEHYKGLNKFGISRIHRKTFVKDFV